MPKLTRTRDDLCNRLGVRVRDNAVIIIRSHCARLFRRNPNVLIAAAECVRVSVP